jgi:hypothetical protein
MGQATSHGPSAQFAKTSIELCQSFGVECSDWIEAHGAQRRDVTRGDGDGGEHGSYAGEDGEVVGRDTVKQAGQANQPLGFQQE